MNWTKLKIDLIVQQWHSLQYWKCFNLKLYGIMTNHDGIKTLINSWHQYQKTHNTFILKKFVTQKKHAWEYFIFWIYCGATLFWMQLYVQRVERGDTLSLGDFYFRSFLKMRTVWLTSEWTSWHNEIESRYLFDSILLEPGLCVAWH